VNKAELEVMSGVDLTFDFILGKYSLIVDWRCFNIDASNDCLTSIAAWIIHSSRLSDESIIEEDSISIFLIGLNLSKSSFSIIPELKL
jgi:hypothetical protein